MRVLAAILASASLILSIQVAVAAGPAPEEIARLRTQAENQLGHETALVLGLYYQSGVGVLQDYEEAAKWYRLCAQAGYDACQLHIGMMHSDGEGVPQDAVLAYMWFNLAASQGGTVAATLRDRIAKTMTQSQIAEAQKLAREWVPSGDRK